MSMEQIEQVFDGMGLSEEATDKIKVIFTAAVNEAKNAAEASLRESIETELNEKAEAHKTYLEEAFAAKTAELQESHDAKAAELVESYNQKVTTLEVQADAYMTESVKQWIAEQQVPLANALKMEKMEAFVSGMRALFAESAILMPDADFSLSEEMQKEIAQLRESNEVLTSRLQTISEEAFASKKAQTFTELSEGLTDLEVEKLRSLAEGIESKTIDEFTSRLNTLKEAFITSVAKPATQPAREQVAESVAQPAAQPAPGKKLSLVEAAALIRSQK